MRVNEEEQGVRLVRFMGAAVLGGLLAAGISMMVLFFCSLGISAGLLSESHMVQYTFAGCVIGGFSGGLFAVLRCRAKTLLVGLGAGCILFLLLLTIGSILYSDISLEQRGVGLLCACLLGGALAGLIGGRPKKKRRR